MARAQRRAAEVERKRKEVEDSANLDVQMLSPEEHIAQLRAKVAENDLSLYIRRIGENVVPVSSLPSCATVKDHKLPLGEANGCIHLDLQYIPFGVDEGGEALEGLSEHMVGEHMISSPRPQPPGGMMLHSPPLVGMLPMPASQLASMCGSPLIVPFLNV